MCIQPMWAAVTASLGLSRYAPVSAVSASGILSYWPPCRVPQKRPSAWTAAGVRSALGALSGAAPMARALQPTVSPADAMRITRELRGLMAASSERMTVMVTSLT